jgi:hypothetical protein
MSDPRDQIRQAIEKLMEDAEYVQDQFAQNYQNEANRPRLQSETQLNRAFIQKTLTSLIGRAKLGPALNTPNSAYNHFVSTWSNGTGDLARSFARISEFWRLLQAARPELDRLTAPQPVPDPPGPNGNRNPAEVAVFTRLRSETNDLFDVFKVCVANHTQLAASRIKEDVRVIGELLNNSSLSHDSVMKLTNSKREWTDFVGRYNNGLGITNATFSQLGHFVTFANIACNQFLGV